MRRKWLKRIGWVLTLPVFLFMLLILLLYIPPVQNFLRGKAVAYASEATGMQINVRRIGLSFPLNLLVDGVEVIQSADTLLTLESLNASVQLMPLFKGKIELDELTLKSTSVNTLNLIEGMQLEGKVELLSLISKGIDLTEQTILVNSLDINGGDIRLCLDDTGKVPEDSASAPLNWKIALESLKVEELSFAMWMPADTMYVGTYLKEVGGRNISAGLSEQLYEVEKLRISGSSVNYDTGLSRPGKGFDPSHIALSDIVMEIDSVMNKGKEIKAIISELSLKERSGLKITSAEGRILTDSTYISLPRLSLQTPYSNIGISACLPWELTADKNSRMEATLSARIGKQDVLLLYGGLSPQQAANFPDGPLSIKAEALGNPDTLTIRSISAELPGAFTLNGKGGLRHLADKVSRRADVQMEMKTGDLSFLTVFADSIADAGITIPQGVELNAHLGIRGTQYTANLSAGESDGLLQIDAAFDEKTQEYSAMVDVQSLDIRHFMPKDSIGILTTNARIKGRGLDFTSPESHALARLTLDTLQYARYTLSDVKLMAKLENSIVSVRLDSNNELLAKAEGTCHLNKPYTQASTEINIKDIDLYKLGITEAPLPHPVSIDLQAKVSGDSVRVALRSGDLSANFRSRNSLESLITEFTGFSELLTRQIDKKQLDHAELRRELPSAALFVNAGKENPLAHYLQSRNIKYEKIRIGFVATPRIGINGRGSIHHLQIDTLQLDSIYFAAHQDTTRLRLRAGVENESKDPRMTFKSTITGEVRSDDAEVTLDFVNGKGETGLLLGVNARPAEDGVLFSLTPEEPVIGFHPFRFDGHNSVFLQNDLRLQADVKMLDSLGMGLRLHSIPDSTLLQNLDVEIRRIELADLSRILPFLADISGLLSLEANYQRSIDDMQVSTEVRIQEFSYARTRIGNLGVGATWLPGNEKQYIDAYLTNEGEEILSASGNYNTKNDALEVNTVLHHFPLYFTNPFFPMEMLELSGDIDGNLSLAGNTAKPRINGELSMHEVQADSYIYGIHIKPEERPLKIQNNRLQFDKYAVYSTGNTENPFTINGYIDFSTLDKAYADISLSARNYPLLNAKRSKTSELYGRAFVDLNSTLKGALNALVMRGSINLLNNTDLTYVMRDSRFTVQDRLSDLVEFTSFAGDSIPDEEKEMPATTFGGLDIILTLNIDPSVKLGVDLSEDRSSYISLKGGGALAFAYTPQGSMSLAGRYEFTDGVVKYALPMIPLKEFAIKEESYVEWASDPMNPTVNIKATERMRVSVPNQNGKGSSMKNFDVSIIIKNKLSDLDLAFDLASPDDSDIQDEINAMDAEERGKQAVAMMVTGIYLAGGGKDGGFDMGSALSTLLQSQMANIAGSALKSVNISFGMDSYDDGSGSTRTDYNFRYSQRLFNDRVQIVIGGRVSTGGDELTRNDSFIDNISLEYRLDASGTRYLRLFHNESQNLLDGEVTDTGVGIVLRKKVNKLGELFIFRRKEKENE